MPPEIEDATGISTKETAAFKTKTNKNEETSLEPQRYDFGTSLSNFQLLNCRLLTCKLL